MGYSYDLAGRLACDHCGNAGSDHIGQSYGVRRRQCPHGYCPAPALCKACAVLLKDELRAYHIKAGCKAAAEKFRAEQQREKDLRAAGQYVRTAAMNMAPGVVAVVFTTGHRGGPERWRLMPSAVYQALPLSAPSTEADFEAASFCDLPIVPDVSDFYDPRLKAAAQGAPFAFENAGGAA